MQEMLFASGVNWNDYPSFFKRGTFIQKRIVATPFDSNLDDLPPKHAARKNPDLLVERIQFIRLDMPPFSKVTNREDVVFKGAEPAVAKEL